MTNRFKFISVGVLLLFIASGLLLPEDKEVLAGSALNWKISVTNPTPYQVQVRATKTGVGDLVAGEVLIAPGGSYTFELGAFCASAVDGYIFVAGQRKNLKPCNCLGQDMTCIENSLATCCWNVSFQIVQKAGQGYTEVRDFDYGFQKN